MNGDDLDGRYSAGFLLGKFEEKKLQKNPSNNEKQKDVIRIRTNSSRVEESPRYMPFNDGTNEYVDELEGYKLDTNDLDASKYYETDIDATIYPVSSLSIRDEIDPEDNVKPKHEAYLLSAETTEIEKQLFNINVAEEVFFGTCNRKGVILRRMVDEKDEQKVTKFVDHMLHLCAKYKTIGGNYHPIIGIARKDGFVYVVYEKTTEVLDVSQIKEMPFMERMEIARSVIEAIEQWKGDDYVNIRPHTITLRGGAHAKLIDWGLSDWTLYDA